MNGEGALESLFGVEGLTLLREQWVQPTDSFYCLEV